MALFREWMEIIERAERPPAWDEVCRNWNGLPETARTRLQAAFPDPDELAGLLGGRPGIKTAVPDPDKLVTLRGGHMEIKAYPKMDHISFSLSLTGPIRKMEQSWYYNNDEIHYDNLNFEKNDRAVKDIGFMRRLLRGSLQAYRRLGVTRITATATQQGAFMWAKLGFLPVRRNEPVFRRAFAENMHELLDHLERCRVLDRTKAAECRAAVRADDPKAIWAVMDMGDAVAYPLLNDTGWLAVFDLSDPEQLTRAFGRPV